LEVESKGDLDSSEEVDQGRLLAVMGNYVANWHFLGTVWLSKRATIY
jgi:hypothetical protein